MRFSHITILSPDGLPTGQHSWLPHSGAYSARELDSMALAANVMVVENRMTGIDRLQKQVQLQDGAVIPYVSSFVCSIGCWCHVFVFLPL